MEAVEMAQALFVWTVSGKWEEQSDNIEESRNRIRTMIANITDLEKVKNVTIFLSFYYRNYRLEGIEQKIEKIKRQWNLSNKERGEIEVLREQFEEEKMLYGEFEQQAQDIKKRMSRMKERRQRLEIETDCSDMDPLESLSI